MSDLEHDMRQVLARLEVVSHGSTYSYSVVASKSGFGDRDGGDGRPPGGTLLPPHERWAAAWNRAGDDDARRRALEGARDELEAITQRTAPLPARLETPAERDQRIVNTRQGWSAGDVAIAERCLPRDVRRARTRARRDPETGDPLPEARDRERLDPAGPAADARRRRLRDLVDRRGYTLADAARVVGVSRSTAERALGRRDAA